MRIATKQTIVLSAVVIAILSANAWWRLRVDAEVFDADMERYHHTMGRGLGAAVAEIWTHDGEERALWLVARANERESDVTIRWVWFDGSDPKHAPAAPVARLRDLAVGHDANWVDDVGHGHLYTYVPVSVPGRVGAIEISEPLTRKWEVLSATRLRILVMTLAVVLSATLVVAALGSFLVSGPARRLMQQARRVGQGDLSQRLALTQRDELGQLASEMNAMCDRLEEAQRDVEHATRARIETVEQLRRMDRMSIVGEIASGLAHELGTPLNVVAGHARMISQREVEGSEVLSSAAVIDEQATRMTRILRALLDFARGWRPEKGVEELGALTAHAVSLVEPLARRRGVTLRCADPGPVHAAVDGSQIEQVVTNLLVNAIDATPAGGQIRWSVHRRDEGGAGPEVVISVVDDGRGIPPEDLPRLFEPFFSTKPAGEGTGLGLPISHGIVDEHGGRIEVRSVVGEGSCFEVVLPIGEGVP